MCFYSYVCGGKVINYDHFYGQGREAPVPGRCPLWDNHEERHERERKAAFEKLRAEDPDFNLEGDDVVELSVAAKDAERARIRNTVRF